MRGRPLLYRVRYQGTKTVAVTPDYAENRQTSYVCGWRRSRGLMRRWRWRWAVMLREFHLDNYASTSPIMRRYATCQC
ncbi:hypothetical protein KCP78_07800 [Salmonella enterica subsp. enterica]|nr:hypothetical protein KCP78_07800 [Salmonella enterica subsp. enterica]